MNSVDLVIIAFFSYHAVVGFKKGLSKIVFDLLGIIIGFMIGYKYYELLGLFLETQFNITPPYSYFISFCLIWFLIYFGIAALGKFIETILSITGISIINRVFGSVFNVIISTFKLLLVIIPLIFINNGLVQSSYIITTTKPVIISLFESHLSSESISVKQIKQTGTQLQNHVN